MCESRSRRSDHEVQPLSANGLHRCGMSLVGVDRSPAHRERNGGYWSHEQRHVARLDSFHQFTTVCVQRFLAQFIHVDRVVRLLHVDWLSRFGLLDWFNREFRIGPQRALGGIEVRRDVLEEQSKLKRQVRAKGFVNPRHIGISDSTHACYSSGH